MSGHPDSPAAAASRQVAVLYVGGYGHSGSTLLEMLVAQDARVLALGEIANAPRAFRVKRGRCTCGLRHAECPVWGPEAGAMAASGDRLTVRDHAALLQRMAERHGAFAWLADSSKTSWGLLFRPWRLRRLGAPIGVVQLVRDPRAVAWSNIKAAARGKAPLSGPRRAWIAAKSAIAWSAAHAACLAASRLGRVPTCRLRYEDFVAATPGARTEFRALGFALEHRATVSDSHGNLHQVAGNRIRHAGETVIRPDEGWRSGLGAPLAGLVAGLTFPLFLAFGYARPKA